MEFRLHLMGSICLPTTPRPKPPFTVAPHTACPRFGMKAKVAVLSLLGIAGGSGLALLGSSPTEAVTFGGTVTATLLQLFADRVPAAAAELRAPQPSSVPQHGQGLPQQSATRTVRGLVRRMRRTAR